MVWTCSLFKCNEEYLKQDTVPKPHPFCHLPWYFPPPQEEVICPPDGLALQFTEPEHLLYWELFFQYSPFFITAKPSVEIVGGHVNYTDCVLIHLFLACLYYHFQLSQLKNFKLLKQTLKLYVEKKSLQNRAQHLHYNILRQTVTCNIWFLSSSFLELPIKYISNTTFAAGIVFQMNFQER